MPGWIMEYWVQWLLGLMGTAFLAVLAYLKGYLKRQKALEEGVKALLHDRLFQDCHQHTKRGWISYEELKNMQHIYEAYHGLGGNGAGTTVFEEVSRLPKHKPEEEKHD